MKRKEIKQNASKTKEGQTEANLTKKRIPRKRYYKVTVKFAHVGVARYYRDSLYLFAQNGSVAAEKARSTPRVKHDHKDAVLGVVEITKEEYEEGVRKNRENPYFNCHSRREQKAHTLEIVENIFEDDPSTRKKTRFNQKIFNQKDGIRKRYNEIPDRIAKITALERDRKKQIKYRMYDFL